VELDPNLALLPLEAVAFQVPERAATVSLQPLVASTVELVPVAVAEGEASGGNGSVGTPTPNSVAPQGKGQTPVPESGADPTTPAEAETPTAAALAQPEEDAAVQRFVLGVDEAPPPSIEPDGTTTTSHDPAAALSTEEPARSDPAPAPSGALPVPVVRVGTPGPKEAEALPVDGPAQRSGSFFEPGADLLGRMVLLAAAWCLPWEYPGDDRTLPPRASLP
jgi:hypothetical protein